MEKTKIALLRVVTLTSESGLDKHAEILAEHYPQFDIDSFCIPDQPDGIYDQQSHQAAIPKIIELAELLADQYQAILISCAADPALTELQQKLTIPVAGAGAVSASQALKHSNKVAVLGMGNYQLTAVKETLGDNLLAYRLLKNVKNTHDFATQAGQAELYQLAFELKAAGAEVIVLACTGMGALEIADDLAAELGIAVIDPLLTAGLYLQQDLQQRK
jgi:Asp/Glu/hydantoin racemase